MQNKLDAYRHPQYAVDVVLCIDGTLTMNDIGRDGQSALDRVKGVAHRIGTDICEIMNRRGKTVEKLRAKVIVFRDYLADGEHAMMLTDFFKLPDQKAEFDRCIDSIKADGGGDEPEDGLEALAYAIRSEWDTEYLRHRKVIIVWSDAGTHDLGFGKKAPHYPRGMASNMAELYDWWEDMDCSKRLILFTPDDNSWRFISDNWEFTLHYPSAAGEGLHDSDYQNILSCIANNI